MKRSRSTNLNVGLRSRKRQPLGDDTPQEATTAPIAGMKAVAIQNTSILRSRRGSLFDKDLAMPRISPLPLSPAGNQKAPSSRKTKKGKPLAFKIVTNPNERIEKRCRFGGVTSLSYDHDDEPILVGLSSETKEAAMESHSWFSTPSVLAHFSIRWFSCPLRRRYSFLAYEKGPPL